MSSVCVLMRFLLLSAVFPSHLNMKNMTCKEVKKKTERQEEQTSILLHSEMKVSVQRVCSQKFSSADSIEDQKATHALRTDT